MEEERDRGRDIEGSGGGTVANVGWLRAERKSKRESCLVLTPKH